MEVEIVDEEHELHCWMLHVLSGVRGFVRFADLMPVTTGQAAGLDLPAGVPVVIDGERDVLIGRAIRVTLSEPLHGVAQSYPAPSSAPICLDDLVSELDDPDALAGRITVEERSLPLAGGTHRDAPRVNVYTRASEPLGTMRLAGVYHTAGEPDPQDAGRRCFPIKEADSGLGGADVCAVASEMRKDWKALPKGKVELVKIELEGGGDEATVRRELRAALYDVQGCYGEQAMNRPGFRGTVTVEMRRDPDAAVTSLTGNVVTTDAEFKTCLETYLLHFWPWTDGPTLVRSTFTYGPLDP